MKYLTLAISALSSVACQAVNNVANVGGDIACSTPEVYDNQPLSIFLS
jgi:hypothetical protein